MTVRDLFFSIAVTELILCAAVGFGRLVGILPPLSDGAVAVYFGVGWASWVVITAWFSTSRHNRI